VDGTIVASQCFRCYLCRPMYHAFALLASVSLSSVLQAIVKEIIDGCIFVCFCIVWRLYQLLSWVWLSICVFRGRLTKAPADHLRGNQLKMVQLYPPIRMKALPFCLWKCPKMPRGPVGPPSACLPSIPSTLTSLDPSETFVSSC
jgi:hypothetical protein